VLLFYILQNLNLNRNCVFFKDVTAHFRTSLHEIVLVLLPPQKLAMSPFWYYGRKLKSEKECGMVTSGMLCVISLEIHQWLKSYRMVEEKRDRCVYIMIPL